MSCKMHKKLNIENILKKIEDKFLWIKDSNIIYSYF